VHGHSPLRTSVSHVSLTTVQTHGSEDFLSMWKNIFLYEHARSWMSTQSCSKRPFGVRVSLTNWRATFPDVIRIFADSSAAIRSACGSFTIRTKTTKLQRHWCDISAARCALPARHSESAKSVTGGDTITPGCRSHLQKQLPRGFSESARSAFRARTVDGNHREPEAIPPGVRARLRVRRRTISAAGRYHGATHDRP
jgi:hypothetical protein